MPSCPPCLTPCWADCLSPASQHPDSLAPFPPCCSKSGCVTQQGKHPRNRPRASLLPPTPTSSAPQPATVQAWSQPSTPPPCQAQKLGGPTSPEEGPPNQHWSELRGAPTLPKMPRSQDAASPGARGDGGAVADGAAGDEPTRPMVL